jgi:UDP-glucose 4-epimerase
MRVLITGGFGFVGGRLGKHLVDSEYEVILGSRKFQEVPNWLPSAKIVQIDWNNKVTLLDACEDIDIVVHTAGMNAHECELDPEKAKTYNGDVTANLVTSAIKQGVKRFIYLSTAHVYRSPLVGTISEYTETTNIHPYATSHLAGENPVLEASENSNMDGIVIRLSNSFGAPAHDHVDCWMLLANDLCRQAIVTGELVLQTHGNQVRDFVPLTDVCRAIEHLIQTDTDRLNSSVLNIGSGKPCTVLEITHLIQDCCMDYLNFKPVINRPASSELEVDEILDFQMTWLSSSNFIFDGEPRLEIKQLLNFCQAHFAKKNFI